MISNNIAQLEEIVLSTYIYHDANYSDDDKYPDDDCSVDSYLDYAQQDNNATGYNQVDSYNFLHDTNTSTPTDILHDFNYDDYSEIY